MIVAKFNGNVSRCSEVEIKRYKNRLSDPFLDRIDLLVTMQNVSVEDSGDVTSKELHVEVLEAVKFLSKRGQTKFNAKLSDEEIECYCLLDKEAIQTLNDAINRFALSFRAIKKIQKVARTIADINKSDMIAKADILEALSYRIR